MLRTALALIAGSLSILRLPELPDPDMFALAIPFTPLLFLSSRYRWLAAFVIGGLLAFLVADARLADRWPLARDGDVVSFSGCIDGFVERDGKFQRFEFRPDDPLLPSLMRLAYYAADPPLQPGECRAVTAKLRSPRGFMNPFGFDYEAWLFRHGIGATGYLRDVGDVVRHQASPIDRLRQVIAERLQVIVDRPVAGLLVALAVGERFAIAPDHWNTLRDTGTAHLLAISGLHVGLVAGLAWWLCGVSRRPQVWRWLPGLALATAYAFLAGFSLSVQRALLMLAVVVAYRLLQRRLHWGQALGVALCLVLLRDPLAVLDAGFWLSFGAVGAILLLVANRRDAGRWLAALRLQAGLSILLAPLVLSQFGLLPLASIPANLVMIPLFAVAIVPAVLLGLVLLPSGFAVTWFNSLAWLLELLVATLDSLLAWLPSLAPHADAALLALAVPGLVLLALPVPLRFRFLGLLPLLPSLLLVPQRPLLGVAMLDVGQGQAVVVHSATAALVYDTGPRIGKADAASWVVLPYLRGKGLVPDMIIASHGDSDHAGGIETLER
ncbi:MAG: DNA internalization-related competence protein ComEC/Rec2, partial [Gammaproteobacteria bacterium]|nr:DNA internalization-related competence protein ComEC/Rec2 [Gammaproteobacteria bacterium]